MYKITEVTKYIVHKNLNGTHHHLGVFDTRTEAEEMINNKNKKDFLVKVR